MLFTIGIPAYNKEDTLERAILSCIHQDTDQEFEIVIVDNASTDRTLEIARTYADQYDNIKVFSNSTTVDLWTNHNLCMKYGSGSYILFCHTDDILYPNALRILYDKLNKRCFPTRYVTWGHSMYNDYKPILDLYHWSIESLIVGTDAYKLFIDGGLTPSGTCYSRASFLDQGGFIPDPYDILPNSDSFSMLKLAFRGFAFEMVDQIYFLRVGSTSKYVNLKTKEQELEDIVHMKKLLHKHFSREQLRYILETSCERQFIYAFFISRFNKELHNRIILRCIKLSTRNPWIIRKEYFMKIFSPWP